MGLPNKMPSCSNCASWFHGRRLPLGLSHSPPRAVTASAAMVVRGVCGAGIPAGRVLEIQWLSS